MSNVKIFSGSSLESIGDDINGWISENKKTKVNEFDRPIAGKNTRITQTETLFVDRHDTFQTLVTYELY